MKNSLKRLLALVMAAALLLPASGIAAEVIPEPVVTIEPAEVTEIIPSDEPEITPEPSAEPTPGIETAEVTAASYSLEASGESVPQVAAAGTYKYNNVQELMEVRGVTMAELVEFTGMSEAEILAMSPETLEELDAALSAQSTSAPSGSETGNVYVLMEKYGVTMEELIAFTGMSEAELLAMSPEMLAELDAALADQVAAGNTPTTSAPTVEQLVEEYGITAEQIAKLFSMSVSELNSLSPESMLELSAALADLADEYESVEAMAISMDLTVAELAEAAGVSTEALLKMTPIQVMALVVDVNLEPTYRFQNAYELANWYGMPLSVIADKVGTTVAGLENMLPSELEAVDEKLRAMGVEPNLSIGSAQQLAEKYGMTVSELAALFGMSETELASLSSEALNELDLALQDAGYAPIVEFSTAQELAEKHGLTLAQVAEKTGYTVNELLAMTPDRLSELDEILSGAEDEPEYKFQSAWELAAWYNMTIEELARKVDATVEVLEAMSPAQLQEIYEQLAATEIAKGFKVENGVLTGYTGQERDIVIPASVTSIAANAFRGSNITTVKLSSNLTTIGEYAFYQCRMLTEIYIPDSVTTIGAYAFSECDSLLSARLPAGLKIIPEALFYSSGKFAQVNIPSGVTEIGKNAFCGDNLSKVTLPAGLKKIGDYAFSGNVNLDDVVLPEGLETIGSSAFSYCKLTEIIVPDSVANMGTHVFANCDTEACALPAGMTVLPEHTFAGCYDLELVILPDKLQTIGADAFSNCSSLAMIDLPDTLRRIERAAFWECSALELVYIPAGVTYMHDEAFFWCDLEKLVLLIPAEDYFIDYCQKNYIMYYYNDRVSYIEYDPAKVTLMAGQKYDPVMYIDFEGVDTITFTTSNKKVATVDSNGVITAKAAGTAKITAKSKKGGAKATITVTVKKAPSKVTLNKKSIEMAVGGSAALKPTIPSGSATEYKWTSSNTKVATVDSTGKITALATGQTTITVTTLNGKKASCVVTVRTAPTALQLETEKTMGVKQSITLKPVIEPEYAFPGLKYETSNASVVQVTSAGKLTAKKAGTATVTVTTDNGISRKMTVTVLAAPTKIKLNASKATMGVGQTGKLTATISPAAAYGEAVYSSSNSKVVAVDQEGNVTALKAGSATITVKTYNGKKATCRITVRKAPSSIKLSAAALTLGVGEDVKLTYTITKKTAASIAWTSSNTNVVKVDDGIVIPVGVGTATVTAATHNGKTASCVITVKAAPTRVKLSQETMTLAVKQKAAIEATLLNGDSTDCAGSLTFASSNSKIATVNSNGIVTAKKAGTATITVKTYNDKVYAVCKVTVVPAPSKVKLSSTKATLGAGETLQLTAAVSPASSQTVFTYSSSKSSVARVDQNGLITAVKPGSATITVKAHNGKKATCKVTVKAAPASLTISAETMLLGVGQTGKLTAAITKNSASALTVTVSDSSVVSVSGSKLTALRPGTAQITIQTFNGLKKTCTVTVKPAPDELRLANTSLVVSVGQSVGLDVTMLAGGSTDCAGELTFKSSSTKVVTMNADGKLTAKRTGTARITVRSHAEDVYAVCTVRVVAAPKSVSLSGIPAALNVGDKLQISPSVLPAGSTAAFTYTSSDASVVSVDASGVVTAVGDGTAVITVKTHNGKKTTCKLTVVAPAN